MIMQFNPPAMGRDIFHYMRLLKVPSSLSLTPSNVAHATRNAGPPWFVPALDIRRVQEVYGSPLCNHCILLQTYITLISLIIITVLNSSAVICVNGKHIALLNCWFASELICYLNKSIFK